MSGSPAGWPARLEELTAQFDDLPRSERIELLLEYAAALPPVPPDLLASGPGEVVSECLSPVQLWVGPAPGSAVLGIAVGETAPTIAAVAAVLIEGCADAPRAELLAIPPELPLRIIGPEMVGQRRLGLAALVQRIQRRVQQLG
ncbi:MAG: SufE family protein [Fimbriimonadaceae bacterium]|nr:SufE family protein [Fimbriimonadaceae bacterium]